MSLRPTMKSTKPKPNENKKKNVLDICLLEEDDEFEEFPVEDWTIQDDEGKEANVWEDNWNNDNIDGDFSVQLRAEFEKKNIPTTI